MTEAIEGRTITAAKENAVALVFGAALVLVVASMFSGSRYDDDEVELEYSLGSGIGKKASVKRDWLSLEVSEINSRAASRYSLSRRSRGVVIHEVGGNREAVSKLREGDVIRAMNGREVDDLRDFREVSQQIDPAQGVLLDIRRNGQPLYVSVAGWRERGRVGASDFRKGTHR